MSVQKVLTLKLKSVSYGGEPIGQEFTFEITVGTATKKIRKNIKRIKNRKNKNKRDKRISIKSFKLMQNSTKGNKNNIKKG